MCACVEVLGVGALIKAGRGGRHTAARILVSCCSGAAFIVLFQVFSFHFFLILVLLEPGRLSFIWTCHIGLDLDFDLFV